MGKTIVLPFGSSKQSRYAVEIKNAVSSTTAGLKVKGVVPCPKSKDGFGETGAKKYCKCCGEINHNGQPISNKLTHKMFDFNGETHIFEADKFDSMISTLENTDIEVTAVLDKEPNGARELYSKLSYVLPSKKQEQQYAELKEIIGDKYLMVEFVERQKHHQGMLCVRNGKIQLRYLHSGDEFNEPSIDVEATPNAEVVALKSKILANKTQSDFDVMEFRSKRAELEEQFFDKLISGEEASVVVEQVVEQAEADGLDELRALAGE